VRIDAATNPFGDAHVWWSDKDGKLRVGAGTNPDGTVLLPTKDER
jgi:hypothetical protein